MASFPSRIVLPVAVGALAVISLVTAMAQASGLTSARYAPPSPAIATAEQIARAYWGTDSCGGTVTVEWERQAADINALSTWASRSKDPYADPASNSDCVIALNSAATFNWPKLCTVIVHEFGHLNGHPHDPQPGRLMSELYTTPLAECITPTARRAAASPAPVTALRAG